MTLCPSSIRPHALILIVVFLLFLLEPVAPLSTTVFGPGSETLALVTAKMVAQAGSSKATQGVNLFAGQDEAGAKLKRTWTKLIAGQGKCGAACARRATILYGRSDDFSGHLASLRSALH